MKKYLLLLLGSLFFISCKTNAILDNQSFDYNVLEKSISLQAYEPQGKVYSGRIYQSDSVKIYGNVPQTVIDSIMEVRKNQINR